MDIVTTGIIVGIISGVVTTIDLIARYGKSAYHYIKKCSDTKLFIVSSLKVLQPIRSIFFPKDELILLKLELPRPKRDFWQDLKELQEFSRAYPFSEKSFESPFFSKLDRKTMQLIHIMAVVCCFVMSRPEHYPHIFKH